MNAVVEPPGRNAIKVGDTVLLDVNGDRQTCLKIRLDGTFKVDRGLICSTEPLIGAQFGSLFEVPTGKRQLEKRRRVCETASEDWESVLEIDRNNSKLLDAGMSNQALTAADIARLKSEGKSGDEIIAALTQNSSTFQNKTQYSQAKYKKKKAKKYLTRVTATKPTARSIADFYFAKTPAKTAWLRSDSLAILLTLANVGAGARVLTVDAVGGLVTGAAMERMGGLGDVLNAHSGEKQPAYDIINLFNFTDSVRKDRLSASLAFLRELMQEDNERDVQDACVGMEISQPSNGMLEETPHDPTSLSPSQQVQPSADLGIEQGGSPPQTTEEGLQHGTHEVKADAAMADSAANAASAATADEIAERQARFARERAEKTARIRSLCRQGFQSCVVAAPGTSPAALMAALLPLLAPSASFAVFFNALPPLAECMQQLKGSKAAVALQLQESWWREYQVLPGRTHPMMSTSGTGGYILSGIKVIQDS